jgi:hypothetical protein
MNCKHHCEKKNFDDCYDDLWHMMNPELEEKGVSKSMIIETLCFLRFIAIELPLQYL